MNPVQPDSPAVILRATTIVVLRIGRAQPGPWGNSPDGWEVRTVDLDVELQEILKGEVMEDRGSRLTVRIRQYRNPSPLYLPLPGAWSEIAAASGTEQLVFAASRRQVGEVASLVAEPACLEVADAAAAPAVRLGVRYIEGKITAAALLDGAAKVPVDLTFAGLLSHLLICDPAFPPHDVFRRVLTLLARPGPAPAVRAALIDAVVNAPGQSGAYRSWHLDQVAIALFRLALDPASGALRENILTIDLPGVLGLRGGTNRSADAVFHDDPGARGRFLAALKAQPNLPGAAVLILWLEKQP